MAKSRSRRKNRSAGRKGNLLTDDRMRLLLFVVLILILLGIGYVIWLG